MGFAPRAVLILTVLLKLLMIQTFGPGSDGAAGGGGTITGGANPCADSAGAACSTRASSVPTFTLPPPEACSVRFPIRFRLPCRTRSAMYLRPRDFVAANLGTVATSVQHHQIALHVHIALDGH